MFKVVLDDSFYKILFPKPKCYVDQSNHNRYFHQRTNNSSKDFSGIDTKDWNGNSYGQFKIIAGNGESY